jgi:hypothetical protein
MPAPQLVPGSPPVTLQRQPAGHLDNDQATAATIQAMCRLIHGAAADPYFAQCARAVPSRWCLPATTGARAVAAGDWAFAKHFLKFVQDAALCQILAGEGDALEGLFDPRLLIRSVQPAGDCDDYTMFLCALLECQGIQWEIVTVAADRSEPGRWSHVYPRAVVGGRRLALDASHGKAPGWEVPAYDVQRFQAWGPDGQHIAAPVRGDVGVSHLHGYERTTPAKYWGMGAVALGLGQGEYGDDPTSDPGGGSAPALTTGPTLAQAGYPTTLPSGELIDYTTDPSASPSAAGGGGSSSSSTNPLAALASQAISTGGALGKEALIPPGYTMLPNGTLVPTAAAATATGSLSAALAGMSGTTILLGCVVLAGLVIAMGSHKR